MRRLRMMRKIILFSLLCLIWGSTWLAIKVGYGGLGPFTVAALRFVIAAAVLCAIVPIVGARWPRGRTEWTLVLVVGLLLFGGDYGLIYWAEQYIDSGLTAVLFGTFPLATMLAAHVYVPGEQLTGRKLAGAAIAFAGVVALFGDRLSVHEAAWRLSASRGAERGDDRRRRDRPRGRRPRQRRDAGAATRREVVGGRQL